MTAFTTGTRSGAARRLSSARPTPTATGDTMLMYFTSGTSGEPKMVAHDYLYPLGHIVTGVFWHNLTEDSIHLTVADTGWGKAAWGKLYGQVVRGGGGFRLRTPEVHRRQNHAQNRTIPHNVALRAAYGLPLHDP